MEKAKILIVEDEAITAMAIQSSLEDMGYRICGIAQTGETALEKAGALSPDLILMDINLAGSMTGIEAAEAIRSQYRIPVVYLTAFSQYLRSQMSERHSALDSRHAGSQLRPIDGSLMIHRPTPPCSCDMEMATEHLSWLFISSSAEFVHLQ